MGAVMRNHSSGVTVTTNIPKPLYSRLRVIVFKAEVEGWNSVYGLPEECSSPSQKYEYIHEKLTFYKKLNPDSNKITKLLSRVDAVKPN